MQKKKTHTKNKTHKFTITRVFRYECKIKKKKYGFLCSCGELKTTKKKRFFESKQITIIYLKICIDSYVIDF